MPPLPGMELGEEPSVAPRALPAGFARKQKWTGNPLALVGLIFSLGGWLLLLVFIFVLPLFAFSPLIFVVLGWVLLRAGRKQAARVLGAFQFGRAVKGTINEVNVDSSMVVNGRSPWRIGYTFQTADGGTHEGSASTFDTSASDRQRGQPVWVLVVDGDPEQNTIYPPVR
jgi:hypothetical protein